MIKHILCSSALMLSFALAGNVEAKKVSVYYAGPGFAKEGFEGNIRSFGQPQISEQIELNNPVGVKKHLIDIEANAPIDPPSFVMNKGHQGAGSVKCEPRAGIPLYNSGKKPLESILLSLTAAKPEFTAGYSGKISKTCTITLTYQGESSQ